MIIQRALEYSVMKLYDQSRVIFPWRIRALNIDKVLVDHPMTDLACWLLLDIFRLSLGRGIHLTQTGLKLFDKCILFFDMLLPNRVSIIRCCASMLRVPSESVTRRMRKTVMR